MSGVPMYNYNKKVRFPFYVDVNSTDVHVAVFTIKHQKSGNYVMTYYDTFEKINRGMGNSNSPPKLRRIAKGVFNAVSYNLICLSMGVDRDCESVIEAANIKVSDYIRFGSDYFSVRKITRLEGIDKGKLLLILNNEGISVMVDSAEYMIVLS